MRKVIMVDGQYQDLRKQLLASAGEKIFISFQNKQIIWKFNEEDYKSYEPKVVNKMVYVKNMLENEIHQIYNLLKNDGIKTRVGDKTVLLPCSLKSITVIK